jgi:DNA gyrase subunit B
LRLGTGEERSGLDLRAVVDHARTVQSVLDGLHHRYNRDVVEQTAIAGALAPTALTDPERAAAAAAMIATRLDGISDEFERGWVGEAKPDGGLKFSRTVRGVTETAWVDLALIHSVDARKLDALSEHLAEVYTQSPVLKRKDTLSPISGPRALLEAVFAQGRRGIQLQRYKGLGEMNPGQLWETTLDPNARSLLQVKVREADDADDIFTKLMGDEVEPRRDFIQENALTANLDA